jgi:hypothetical protein
VPFPQGVRGRGGDGGAALAAEDVLAADETPVTVLGKTPARHRTGTGRRTRKKRTARPQRPVRRTC